MSDFPVEALRDARDSLAPAYRRIADELRRVIDEYDLEPGTKLPSETQLVSRFDVARMTARPAFRKAHAEQMAHWAAADARETAAAE